MNPAATIASHDGPAFFGSESKALWPEVILERIPCIDVGVGDGMNREMERRLEKQIRSLDKWGLRRGSPIWLRFFIECDSSDQRERLIDALSDCGAYDLQARYDRAYGFEPREDHFLIAGQTVPFPFDPDQLRERLERIHAISVALEARVLPLSWHLGQPTTTQES